MKTYECQICGRKLTDSESIANGVGPECAAKRTSFFTTCGTSEAEIANLENAGEQSARWIRNFRQDMRKGRARDARRCIEAARRAVGHREAQALGLTGAAYFQHVNNCPANETLTTTAAPVMAPVTSPVIASEPPQPAIVVRSSERGYRVHPPYRHPQFVAAFKRTVSGRWYAESSEWFIPATCLAWAKELLEYWFSMPVYIENAAR